MTARDDLVEAALDGYYGAYQPGAHWREFKPHNRERERVRMRAALDALLSEPVFGEAVERAASAVLDACPYEGDRDAWGRCIALAALRAALCAPGVADKS